MLQDLVPKTNEAAARIWINAFLFRASAMSPPDKKLVLSVEQGVSATAVQPSSFTTVSGYVDYAVVVAAVDDAEIFLRHPVLEKLKGRETLFILEAKTMESSLANHVPQAVSEMHACAKKLGKRIIRGALTQGQDWIFIVLRMNDDGFGAEYAESGVIGLMDRGLLGNSVVSLPGCIMLAGIISYWISHSNQDIGEDDWFTVKWRENTARV